MLPQFQKHLFHALSSIGKRQADINTPLADADLDKRIKGTVTIEDVVTGEVIYDCSEEDIFDETLNARLRRFRFSYPSVTAQQIAFWLAFQLGAAASPVASGAKKLHLLSRSVSDELPKLSYMRGYEDDMVNPAQKFSGLACESVQITLNRRKNVTMECVAVGRFLGTDAGLAFVIPACENLPPLKGANCKMSIDGVDYTANLWNAVIALNNAIPVGDDAFPFNGIDAQTLQRGQKPTYPITAQILGSRTDVPFTLADSRTKKPVAIQLGADTDDHVVITTPNTLMKLATQALPFVGELNRSAIALDLTPHKDATLGTPIKAEAYLDQATAFLTS